MPDVSFTIWWVLAPLLAWLAFTLCVTLVRERRRHAARLARTRRAAGVLANGVPAMALVISLCDTGQRRSGEGTTWAIAKLHLHVQATAGSEAFDVDQTTAIALPDLPDHAAGKTVAVRFDPVSREVVLERRGNSPAHHGDDLTRLRPSPEAAGR
jgi:hypothetical protein